MLLVEPQCWGYEHVEVNSALLLAHRAAYPGDKILFLAEASHLALVKKRLGAGEDDFLFKQVVIPLRDKSGVRRCPKDLLLVGTLLHQAVAFKARRIVFCSVTATLLYALKLLLPFYRGMSALLVLHSNLASLDKVESYRPWHYLFRFKFALFLPSSQRISYLVYGDFIGKQIQQNFPRLFPYIRAVNHPYIFPELNWSKTDDSTVFGSLGNGRLEKGTDTFFTLANEISSCLPGKNVRFLLIGHVYDTVLLKLAGDAVILTSADNQPLSRNDYEKSALSIDYAVFCYHQESYRYFASGALLDALSFVKPIIALRTPMIEYCFEQMGDIGYLCDDYDQMKAVLLSLVNTDSYEKYEAQRQNILRGRYIFSPGFVAKQLTKVLTA